MEEQLREVSIRPICEISRVFRPEAQFAELLRRAENWSSIILSGQTGRSGMTVDATAVFRHSVDETLAHIIVLLWDMILVLFFSGISLFFFSVR